MSDRDVPHRRKINPRPPAQRFMKPPLSRYMPSRSVAQMVLMSRRGPLLERGLAQAIDWYVAKLAPPRPTDPRVPEPQVARHAS